MLGKGQKISEAIYLVLISSNKQTKIIFRSCPNFYGSIKKFFLEEMRTRYVASELF